MQIYENFISYRRSESMAEVQSIYQALLQKGISTFCDIYSLNAGRFDEGLIRTIDSCTNFILVLNEKTLDRCFEPDDWITKEISEAISKNKNIICVFIGDYVFPENLPKEIDDIRYYNGIRYDYAYFSGFIDCLMSRFLLNDNEIITSDPINDFVIDEDKLIQYIGLAKIVKIPDGIKEICSNAFKDKTYITNVEFPATLETIGEHAFERCIGLTYVYFPDHLKAIKEKAFSRCYNLSFVALNDELKRIEDAAFSFCTNLRSVNFGVNIEYISQKAFNNCSKLSFFVVSEDNNFYSSYEGILYSKDKKALVRCPEAYERDVIHVLDSVEILGEWCFSKCINVIDIVLSQKIKSIKAYAFNACNNILSLSLCDGIVEFDLTAITGWTNSQRVIVSKRFSKLLKFNIDKQIQEQTLIEKQNGGVVSKFILIKTTFESIEEASKMAKMLLERKYIASAQIYHLDVFYSWNDEFCNEKEYELSCITRGELFPVVEKFIIDNHSYELCQIICLPIINESSEFCNWILEQIID